MRSESSKRFTANGIKRYITCEGVQQGEFALALEIMFGMNNPDDGVNRVVKKKFFLIFGADIKCSFAALGTF